MILISIKQNRENMMLKIIKFIFVNMLLFISAAYAANEVAVPSNEARIWANTKGNELLQTLSLTDVQRKFANLDKMMTEDVNLDYVGKFVIGKYARLMTIEQKQKYHNLFRRYVLSLYKKSNFNFNSEAINFSIESVAEFNKYTNVLCLVDTSKLVNGVKIEKIPVKFKLIRNENNAIQAVDVEISNVSMVIEYRKRFYQMIINEKGDMVAFLEKFEDKVKANEEAAILKLTQPQ